MRQMYIYLMLLMTLSTLYYFTGLNPSGVTSTVFKLAINPQNFFTLNWNDIFNLALTSVGAAVGIVLGIYTKNYELSAFAPIASILIGYLTDFISIVSVISSVSRVFALIVVAPFVVLYSLVVMDYWRGRD